MYLAPVSLAGRQLRREQVNQTDLPCKRGLFITWYRGKRILEVSRSFQLGELKKKQNDSFAIAEELDRGSAHRTPSPPAGPTSHELAV